MFLLDTNVVSELRRPSKADRNVLAWAESVPLVEQYVSVVTIMEVEQGVLAKERVDAAQGKALREWFDGTVRVHFAGRVVAFDESEALCCASLHVPNTKSYRDAMIGATALVHGMTVVTRNTSDFEAMKDGTGRTIKLFNPWLGSG
jgi:predicted nucleic acid-binding protein